MDRGDLAVHDEQVGILENRFLALWIGHEVRREEALVELHALGELELEPEGVGLLDRDGPVLADLVDRICENLADGDIRCRDGSDLRDLLTTLDFSGLVLDRLDRCSNSLLDATLQRHRVGSGCHVAKSLAHQRLGEHRRGGRPVACHVVGLRRDFLHELGAHVLEMVLELYVTGDRDTVVGNRRRTELLVEHDVAALRAEGHLDSVGELVDADLQPAPRMLVENKHLGHQ